ncbi:MAG: membrane dipeptidase, partial [Bacteroidales bacterium]|nr:membrane dipeptidase [Bacteroidales bacterium]
MKTIIASTVTLLLVTIMWIPSGLCQNDVRLKALKIHQAVYTVDSHNDTPMGFGESGFDPSIRHDFKDDESCVDFPRMKEGGLDGAFFAVFTGQGPLTDEGRESAYLRAKKTFGYIRKTVELHPEMAGIALTPKDGYKLEKQGKISMFIGLENGYPIGQDISRVGEFYNLGARYITLCHTRNNDICDSSTDRKGALHNGLSDFGKQVVPEMNKLGIMIDVSHMSDKSFYDVIELSKTPVIASHSCARALCNNPRNLGDEMLTALAKNGGVIQMCILSGYVKEQEPNPARDSAFSLVQKKYGDWSKLSPETQKLARADYSEIMK